MGKVYDFLTMAVGFGRGRASPREGLKIYTGKLYSLAVYMRY
jgi:hypothetical protein